MFSFLDTITAALAGDPDYEVNFSATPIGPSKAARERELAAKRQQLHSMLGERQTRIEALDREIAQFGAKAMQQRRVLRASNASAQAKAVAQRRAVAALKKVGAAKKKRTRLAAFVERGAKILDSGSALEGPASDVEMMRLMTDVARGTVAESSTADSVGLMGDELVGADSELRELQNEFDKVSERLGEESVLDDADMLGEDVDLDSADGVLSALDSLADDEALLFDDNALFDDPAPQQLLAQPSKQSVPQSRASSSAGSRATYQSLALPTVPVQTPASGGRPAWRAIGLTTQGAESNFARKNQSASRGRAPHAFDDDADDAGYF